MNTEEQVFKLTIALYKVADSFPKDEVLKQTLQKQGLKILELVVKQEKDNETVLKNIKTIQSYLQVAKSLRVTNPVNLEVLQREYRKLAEGFLQTDKPVAVVTTSSLASKPLEAKLDTRNDMRAKPEVISEINDRQKTILEYLKQNKQARVGDLQDIFKNVSAKTIQRDLHDLVERNILARDGDKRWTTYYLTQ